jgi:hypothetical protein
MRQVCVGGASSALVMPGNDLQPESFLTAFPQLQSVVHLFRCQRLRGAFTTLRLLRRLSYFAE